MKTTPATNLVTKAGMSIGQSPYQSDTCRTKGKLVTIPTAHAAYITVIVIDDKLSVTRRGHTAGWRQPRTR